MKYLSNSDKKKKCFHSDDTLKHKFGLSMVILSSHLWLPHKVCSIAYSTQSHLSGYEICCARHSITCKTVWGGFSCLFTGSWCNAGHPRLS